MELAFAFLVTVIKAQWQKNLNEIKKGQAYASSRGGKTDAVVRLSLVTLV